MDDTKAKGNEMTAAKLTKEKEKAIALAARRYDIAQKIREVLDEARKEWGPKDWDEDGIESEILELVTEE